jgi:hypothetical protein
MPSFGEVRKTVRDFAGAFADDDEIQRDGLLSALVCKKFRERKSSSMCDGVLGGLENVSDIGSKLFVRHRGTASEITCSRNLGERS